MVAKASAVPILLLAILGCRKEKTELEPFQAYEKFATAFAHGRFGEAEGLAGSDTVRLAIEERKALEPELNANFGPVRKSTVSLLQYTEAGADVVIHARIYLTYEGPLNPTSARQHMAKVSRVDGEWRVVEFDEK